MLNRRTGESFNLCFILPFRFQILKKYLDIDILIEILEAGTLLETVTSQDHNYICYAVGVQCQRIDDIHIKYEFNDFVQLKL